MSDSTPDTLAEDGPPVDPAVVTIGPLTLRLQAPTDPIVAIDIITYRLENQRRAEMAALGLCWRGADRPKGFSYSTCKFSPARFGGEVERWALAKGYPWSDLMSAASLAADLIAGALPDLNEELAEAEDFTATEAA
jgi:hypothetical protein